MNVAALTMRAIADRVKADSMQKYVDELKHPDHPAMRVIREEASRGRYHCTFGGGHRERYAPSDTCISALRYLGYTVVKRDLYKGGKIVTVGWSTTNERL